MSVIVHACNPVTWEFEAGGSENQVHLQLYRALDAVLSSRDPTS